MLPGRGLPNLWVPDVRDCYRVEALPLLEHLDLTYTGVVTEAVERLPRLPSLRSHALYSQVAMHQAYGGVVPELASRDHIRRVLPLTREVLAQPALAAVLGEALSKIRATGRVTEAGIDEPEQKWPATSTTPSLTIWLATATACLGSQASSPVISCSFWPLTPPAALEPTYR